MKKRRLKELYQLALDNFDKKPKGKGICYIFCYLWVNGKIGYGDKEIIVNHFYNRKPFIFSKFFWNNSYSYTNMYWWAFNKAGDEQRKLFLKHLISKL